MASEYQTPGPIELSFHGFAEDENTDSRGFPETVVNDLNSRRRQIAKSIEAEIAGLLLRPIEVERKLYRENFVEVEIRFVSGSLLWDGWITVQGLFHHSYLAETVLNDAAIIGGWVGLYDLLRRAIGKCIDKAVTEELQYEELSRHSRYRAKTRVIIATSIGSGNYALTQKIDELENQTTESNRRLEEKISSMRREIDLFRTIGRVIFMIAGLAGSVAVLLIAFRRI
jgi:hypothetical protein